MAKIGKEAEIYSSFEILHKKKQKLEKQLRRSQFKTSEPRTTSCHKYGWMVLVMDCQLWGENPCVLLR